MVSSAAGAAESRRPENLALVYQELFTVIERMRSNRLQVPDSGAFRAQVKEMLRAAVDEARRRGYSDESIKLGQYAAVAFLDESILNLRWPVFADWPRQPLQEDLYQHHIAGEVFFQNLQALLGRNDSQELADLLEVYQLCLQLGFAGRYSIGGRAELRAIMDATAQKIRRIRQTGAELSRNWKLPPGQFTATGADVWVKRLMIASGAAAGLALVLFLIYKFILSGGISRLGDLVA
jgi:type VI secretion system protein ImpK